MTTFGRGARQNRNRAPRTKGRKIGTRSAETRRYLARSATEENRKGAKTQRLAGCPGAFASLRFQFYWRCAPVRSPRLRVRNLSFA
jgi:hypothetical protein